MAVSQSPFVHDVHAAPAVPHEAPDCDAQGLHIPVEPLQQPSGQLVGLHVEVTTSEEESCAVAESPADDESPVKAESGAEASVPVSGAVPSPVASGVAPVSIVPSPPASEDDGPPSSPVPEAKSPRRVEHPPSIATTKRPHTAAAKRRELMQPSLA